jgi:hypothetical protein
MPVRQLPYRQMPYRRLSFRGRAQQGYIMLVALLLMAIMSVIGASSLQVAGIDQRIALQNRKHIMVMNTAAAGTEHARDEMRWTEPVSEGIDSNPDTYGDFVTASDGETDFGGIGYTHNLGVYWVTATFHRCGNPPPGYSTELGANKFRSDYWEMESTARMAESDSSADSVAVNETLSSASMLIRHIKFGTCKVR